MKYIRDKELLEKGDKVLVCVSGGADSIALWDVLQRGGFECIVAHCNFHLRGEESDRDEAFVMRLSEKVKGDKAKGERVLVKHFDTEGYAQEKGLSIEMAARELRYKWFARVAEAEGCKAIAVAHHQNDQAETLLLNLKRGAGIRGLCGMRAKSDNPYGGEVSVIRPLLCTTRDYIEHYLRDIRGLEWVNDSTNADTTIKRNGIREQLKGYSKAEIEHIAATAQHLQGYVDMIEGKDSAAAGQAKLFEELKEYGFAEIDKIYHALQAGVGGKVFRSSTHQATIKKGKLVIETLKL
jgi:tRNA(Ile)-lysidine synthase